MVFAFTGAKRTPLTGEAGGLGAVFPQEGQKGDLPCRELHEECPHYRLDRPVEFGLIGRQREHVTEQIRIDEVPAIGVIRIKLGQIDAGIEIVGAGHDFDTGGYTLSLRSGDRETAVVLSRELVDDLRDNPSGATTKYTQALNDRLTVALLTAIERNGLVSYNESNLKFLLLRYINEEANQSRPVHKYNAIGKSGRGGFEQWLGKELRREEKETLIWAWDELRRLRLITPTGTDLVNPDDWVRVTEKGIAAIEGKDYAEYVEGEVFINKGEVYTAYTKIKAILRQARRELLIIDPHLSGEVIEMLSTLDVSIRIRLLGTYFHGDFKLALKKLQKERGKIEVRQSDHFHDRFIVVDSAAAYQLGGSIKDAGAKATVIDKKEDSTAQRILKEAEGIWTTSTIL